MQEAPRRRGQIRLGDLVLDLSSAEIGHDGVRHRLPDQVFEVLVLLTERPGALVTREELVARLWPRTTYIDTEAGLNTAVKKLRAALGDDADHPRYVETVPRRGYRLIAPVKLVEPEQVGEQSPPPPAPVHRPDLDVHRGGLSRRRILIGTLIGAAATVLVAWFVAGRHWLRTPVAAPADFTALPQGNVAVLPFLNLTGDSQRDNLALGLPESVLHELAQLRGVNVVAHTSSFAVHRDSGDVREIGRRLNARYLLEGSLQGSASRLRITTQLIDASSGTHLWSKSFDRPAQDLFAIQDEIAREVARAIRPGAPAADAAAPLLASGTHNLDAWLAFQRGRELAATRRRADLEAALASFQSAVRLDPQFARAYVELADTYLLRYQYAPPEPAATELRVRRQATSEAAAAVARALAIDPNLGDALVVRGYVAHLADDYGAAEADYRSGIALSPNSARGYQLLGELLVDERGKDEEGLAMIERARLLDPLEPRGPYYQGIAAMLRGSVTDAERAFLAALELRSDYAPALGRLSMLSWWGRGQFADAVKYGERALLSDPRSEWIRGELMTSYLEIGELESARRLLPSDAAERIDSAWLKLFEGDSRRAGALVYAEPDRADLCDRSSEPYALLEHARITHEYGRARHFLEQHAGGRRAQTITLQADPPIVAPGAEQAATVLAQLLESAGDRVRARRLLEATLAQLDRASLPLSGKCVNVNRSRARALALLGRYPEALDALSRGVLRDNAWYYGWYLFYRDPAFAQLHADPRFQALRAAYAAHIDAERNKLAELRAAGLVAAARL